AGRPAAGLEEAAQLAGRQIAAARLRLPAHCRDAGRRLIVLDAHYLGAPTFAKHATQRGEHAIGGGRLVVLLEQAPDPEHVGAAEPLPGQGLGRIDLGSTASDPVQLLAAELSAHGTATLDADVSA